MYKSPFKFLDSFGKDDKEIFFGREKETEELYSRVFESKILLVYGTSGTGKTSLINCGLANKFDDSDWLPVSIRRGHDINISLFEALEKNALTRYPFGRIKNDHIGNYDLGKLLQSVYLDHFKPLFLIFDQFEELFIFGRKEEKEEFIRNIAPVVNSEIQVRFIFSLREEYLAGVTDFEKVIPSFLSNRMRIEKMTRQNAIETINGPCRVRGITVEAGFAEELLEKLNPASPEIELTWLQVFLDKIVKLAADRNEEIENISRDMITRIGDVKDILGSFLEEQVSQLSDPEKGLTVLKSFVSVKGTRNQVTADEIIDYSTVSGKRIDGEEVREFLRKFVALRILKDKDENGRYELRHDSLALKIFEKITLVEKEIREVRFFIENAWMAYEKRNILLNADDLAYIAPFEDKLFLSEKYNKFISLSKLAIRRAKRRKQNALLITGIAIIVILSFFTVWATNEKKNALDQKQIAENQKDEALKAKTEADIARQEAVVASRRAEENEKLAIEARNQSENDRWIALTAKESALKEKNRAEQLSVIANEQAQKAEHEKQVADEQKAIALSAEEKARKLGRRSAAQNLALKSLILEKNPGLMGLLAVEAYKMNMENEGSPDDPVIFEALDKAWKVIDSARHTWFRGSENVIRSLAENNNRILSADLDGNILEWDFSGTYKKILVSDDPSFIDFVSLSPTGDKLLTGYENGYITIRDIDRYKSSGPVAIEKEGTVRSASWIDSGNSVLTSCSDSVLSIWGIDQGMISAGPSVKMPVQARAVLFLNPDSVFTVDEDGTLSLRNMTDGNHKVLYSPVDIRPLCLAWDRYRNILFTGCSDGSLVSLSLDDKTGIKTADYPAHTAGIDQITLSRDYKFMATASWDKTVRIYNMGSFLGVAGMAGGTFLVNDLKDRSRVLMFTGKDVLIAGMEDKSLRLWETSADNLIKEICSRINRDMTIEEWNENVGMDIPYEKTCGTNK